MLYIVGIDPGPRNAGVAVFDNTKLIHLTTIISKTGNWQEQYRNILDYILDNTPWPGIILGVEDSQSFGARKGIIGLHKLVGALSTLVGCKLIQPKDKPKLPKKYEKLCKTEHEKDAICLALKARQIYKKRARSSGKPIA